MSIVWPGPSVSIWQPDRLSLGMLELQARPGARSARRSMPEMRHPSTLTAKTRDMSQRVRDMCQPCRGLRQPCRSQCPDSRHLKYDRQSRIRFTLRGVTGERREAPRQTSSLGHRARLAVFSLLSLAVLLAPVGCGDSRSGNVTLRITESSYGEIVAATAADAKCRAELHLPGDSIKRGHSLGAPEVANGVYTWHYQTASNFHGVASHTVICSRGSASASATAWFTLTSGDRD